MIKNKRLFVILCSLVVVFAGLKYYESTVPKPKYVDIGITPDSVFVNTNNLTINDLGTGEIHFYCSKSEFYIHIGNATMILREVNGTIQIEGVEFIDP